MKRRKRVPWVGSSQKGTLPMIGRSVWRQSREWRRKKEEAQRSIRGNVSVSAARRWSPQIMNDTNAKGVFLVKKALKGVQLFQGSRYVNCETSLHFFCIQGIKKEFFDSCNLAMQVYGCFPVTPGTPGTPIG